MDQWQKKRVLVLGTTYPNYSRKYTELVCTGGIDEETGKMVRIHPLPIRYLEPEHRFKNFQWIRGKFQPNTHDGRPESLRVEPDSICVEDEIPSTHHETRRSYIEQSPSLVDSVEALIDRSRKEKVSLGTVVPKEILGTRIVRRSSEAKNAWIQKERELMDQVRMPFLKPPKKLDFPEAEFLVQWVCHDKRCRPHEMGLKTWGLHELYRKLADDPDRDSKVKQQMDRWLDLNKRDVYLFLGTFVGLRFEFGLMDAYSAPKTAQLSLLLALVD